MLRSHSAEPLIRADSLSYNILYFLFQFRSRIAEADFLVDTLIDPLFVLNLKPECLVDLLLLLFRQFFLFTDWAGADEAGWNGNLVLDRVDDESRGIIEFPPAISRYQKLRV